MSGTPRYIDNGINDLSVLPKIIERTEAGQQIPKFFIRAAKGNFKSQVMSGAEALAYYGPETFDPKGSYFNHQTAFLRGAMQYGKVAIERVDMNGKKASITHCIDVATVTRDIPGRDAFGNIDATAAAILTDVSTLKFRHVAIPNGALSTGMGTMKNGDDSPSTLYPIFKIEAGVGSWYNNLGYNLMPNRKLSREEILDYKQFMYDFKMLLNSFGTIKSMKTLAGSEAVKVSLREGTNPVTNLSTSLGDTFDESYYNEKDYAIEWRYRDATITVNEDNIQIVQNLIAANEAFIIDKVDATTTTNMEVNEWFDVIPTTATKYEVASMLNVMNFQSSNGNPYFGCFIDEVSTIDADFVARDENGVELDQQETKITVGNANTNFFLSGGKEAGSNDTEDNIERYNNVVKAKLQDFLDKNSAVQEIALHQETTFWDSGFPVDVKKEFGNVIALRGDTAAVLSTYYVNAKGDQFVDEADQIAIGVMLKNRLMMTPESTYFGTSVGRAVICGGDCLIKDSDFNGRVPTTYDLLIKVSAYMGAGNKKWKNAEAFDAGDESAATNIIDIFPKFVPPSIKGKKWAIGINWLEPLYDEKVYHWPAFFTVAPDNSTRNSLFVMAATQHINRLEVFAWKKFTGESRLAPAMFLEKVELYMASQLSGKFDSRFLLKPTATITSKDNAVGYQWHLDTRVGTNNMYTVVRNSTTVVRKSDF